MSDTTQVVLALVLIVGINVLGFYWNAVHWRCLRFYRVIEDCATGRLGRSGYPVRSVTLECGGCGQRRSEERTLVDD